MRRLNLILRSARILLLLAFFPASQLACSPSTDDARDAIPASVATQSAPNAKRPADPTRDGASDPARTSAATISVENVFDNESSWPNIASLVESWTPAGESPPLKKGYRGAVIRLLPGGLVRIDFGRHGKHEIPIAATDFVARANEVEAGTRFKTAPNFLAHFGTQFVHPTSPEPMAFPTPELAKSDRFLCIFADPSPESFAELAERLAALDDVPKLQGLMFPLAVERDQIQAVKDRLEAVGWRVPYAYPQAAEKHAESLLGAVPTRPMALLITGEGRLLLQTELDRPGAIEALRTAVTSPSP